MVVVLHLDYGVRDSFLGQLVSHHTLDASVNLSEGQMSQCEAQNERTRKRKHVCSSC